MDVSVIIPAFNTEQYVTRAIRSVLEQTRLAVEVIVVDDASTDETRAAVEAIDDPRVRLIRQPRNTGPSHCRNRGLDEARGRYVAFVDADDWCAPRRLDRLVALAEAARADVASDNLFLIDEGQDVPWADAHTELGLTYATGDLIAPAEFVREGWVVKSVIRTAALAEAGLRFDPQVAYGEDYMLYTQLLLSGCRWVVCADPLYYHVARAGSITHSGALPEDLLRYLSQMARRAQHGGQQDLARAFRHKRDRIGASVVLRRMLAAVRRRDGVAAVAETARMVRYASVYLERFRKMIRRNGRKKAVAGGVGMTAVH